MANTYYNSQLTAAEIEAALEAIDGVIVPANNGKVLAIENGTIVAKSVTEYTETAVLEPLSVTANGDYIPKSGVDGFNSVHVAVPSGGGSDTAVLFSLTNESVVSRVIGQCVKQGKQASCDLQVFFNSTYGSKQHVFTIPDGFKPAGYYRGHCGSGSNISSNVLWEIYPDGKVYFRSIPSYLYVSLRWIVAEQTVAVDTESIVTSIIGGIAVNGNCADLSALLVLNSGANAWEDLFSIPASVAPSTAIRPFIKASVKESDVESTGYYRDSMYDVSTRMVSQWRGTAYYDQHIYIQASWIIEV